MHYLNNAGASIMSDETLAAVTDHFVLERQLGPYGAARSVAEKMSACYSDAAAVLNAPSSSDISLHDSASRAWNMALYGCGIGKGDHIVTLSSEFGTNLVSLHHYAEQVGARVQVVHCDEQGLFDKNELERQIAAGAKLVAVSHAAAHGSIVNPVADIGILAAKYDAKYLVDGCQAVGQIPVDVRDLKCDAYTASGRKWLRGPRGTAFLYVNPDSALHTPQVDLASADLEIHDGTVIGVKVRADGRQFELWERSTASFVGLGRALKQYLDLDTDLVARDVAIKSRRIRNAASSNPSMRIVGSIDAATGITGFYLSDPSREEDLERAFGDAGVVISTMADWDCPLHFPTCGATKIYRLSPHFYTTSETIDITEQIIAQFR